MRPLLWNPTPRQDGEGLDPEEKRIQYKKRKDPRGQPRLIDLRQQANASNTGTATLNEKIREDNNLYRASPYTDNMKRKEKRAGWTGREPSSENADRARRNHLNRIQNARRPWFRGKKKKKKRKSNTKLQRPKRATAHKSQEHMILTWH